VRRGPGRPHRGGGGGSAEVAERFHGFQPKLKADSWGLGGRGPCQNDNVIVLNVVIKVPKGGKEGAVLLYTTFNPFPSPPLPVFMTLLPKFSSASLTFSSSSCGLNIKQIRMMRLLFIEGRIGLYSHM